MKNVANIDYLRNKVRQKSLKPRKKETERGDR